MRAAPVGLFCHDGDLDRVFGLAVETAALTHGHPSGQLSAGYLAVTIAALAGGATLDEALAAANSRLCRRDHHRETAEAVDAAKALARRGGAPTPEDLETLGGGWLAEEALAIAVCCALTARSLEDGVAWAANHSGDSDSTAAIAGNILGAQLGEQAIPERWLARLELRTEIAQLADDLHAALVGELDPEAAWEHYPGW